MCRPTTCSAGASAAAASASSGLLGSTMVTGGPVSAPVRRSIISCAALPARSRRNRARCRSPPASPRRAARPHRWRSPRPGAAPPDVRRRRASKATASSRLPSISRASGRGVGIQHLLDRFVQRGDARPAPPRCCVGLEAGCAHRCAKRPAPARARGRTRRFSDSRARRRRPCAARCLTVARIAALVLAEHRVDGERQLAVEHHHRHAQTLDRRLDRRIVLVRRDRG